MFYSLKYIFYLFGWLLDNDLSQMKMLEQQKMKHKKTVKIFSLFHGVFDLMENKS